MNGKALIPLVAGLVFAGFGAKLGLDYVKKARGETAPTVQLWAPLENIPRGTMIEESMLQELAFPKNVAPADAIADKSVLIGRIPHTGAPAGLPLLASMLLPPGTLPGIQVPPGFRAVAVKINDGSGVDNHLQPGSRVDVIGYFPGRGPDQTIAQTILEDIEVAAVGQKIAPDAPGRGDEEASGKSGRREKPARAVTLLVRPADVPTLHMAEQKGKIKLSMRSTFDTARSADGDRVTDSGLLGEDKPDKPEGESFLAGLFSSFMNTEAADPEPAPVVASIPLDLDPDQPKPKIANVMVIYNGEDRRVLAWTANNPRRAIELTNEGPNLFEDDPDDGLGQGNSEAGTDAIFESDNKKTSNSVMGGN